MILSVLTLYGISDGMINGNGAVVWNENCHRKPKNSEKTCLVPLCPPQFPCDLTWDRTLAAVMGSWQLANQATEWFASNEFVFSFICLSFCLITYSAAEVM
jgi:hypothetical protein